MTARVELLALDGTLRDTLFFSLVREEYEAQLPKWRIESRGASSEERAAP